MSTRVLDRVEQWDKRPFTDGYRGLQRLADQAFSGVVRADGLELFLTRGVAVAVRGGDIEGFEGTSGTVHRAPSPALPLLAVMQERSDEVRDRFYTEQTPISTVDQTLSDGGFTGYIELSENVLSGDYYLVYHAGNSMSVAFIGQSRRFVGGSQAFESADDEVGIYRVRPVDVHPLDIPKPEPREPEQTEPEIPGSGDETPDATSAADADGAEAAPESGDEETDAPAAERRSVESEPDETDEESTPAEVGTGVTDTRTDADVRTIPSVDPARTVSKATNTTASESATDRSATVEQPSHDETPDDSGGESDTSPVQQSASDREAESEPGDDATAAAPAEFERLEQRLDNLEAECEALQDRLDAAQAERDELREHLAAIRDDHDER